MAKQTRKTRAKSKAVDKTAAVKSARERSVELAKLPKAKAVELPETVVRHLPSARSIAERAWLVLWQNRKLFIIILLIYAICDIVFVQSLVTGDVDTIKTNVQNALKGQGGSLLEGVVVFAGMFGSASGGTPTAQAYQPLLMIIISLAIIWSLRQLLAGKSISKAREAFYKGMTPLVPFSLTLLAISVQLLPAIILSALYDSMITNGILLGPIEQYLGLAVVLAGCVLSLWWISSSVFALYISTLPNVWPLAALRNARKLTDGIRWLLIRKLIFLPVVVLIPAAAIMVPFIMWASGLAQIVFFIMWIIGLGYVHAYLFILYKDLIGETE